MKRSLQFPLFLIALLIVSSCKVDKEIFVAYSDPEIMYEGRIDTSRIEAAELYWSGSSIKINFQGDSIAALMRESRGDNYYNVIIDEDEFFILRPDTVKQYYTLASGLAPGKHSVELFKRTEWDRGRGEFYGFRIGGKAKVELKSPAKKRKIEFYGNSITAGYAVEDFSGADSPDSIFTNNYLSYSTILARHYDAEYHCTCKSGIGITISWFPAIMPEIYDLLNPEDPQSSWDFSLYQPDLVVINLMQNDSWLVNMPAHDEFQARFGEVAPDEVAIIKAFQLFVANIRKHYPHAQIICALGNMDATREGSQWPAYVTQAVDNLRDDRIYTHFIAYKDSPGHPTISEQEDMASSFIKFIDEHIDW
ncbi:MAG: SGNH/GDSL hydrolase family protein [Bacteroides sp.]|nr:SGNH/GDSL hydrolase family protein [Bacteroides sp.]